MRDRDGTEETVIPEATTLRRLGSSFAESWCREELRVNRILCCWFLLFAGTALIGSTYTHTPNGLLAASFLMPVAAVPAALLHDANKVERRDAAVTLIWAVGFMPITAALAAITCNTSGLLPLRDMFFLRADLSIGVSAPAVFTFMQHHPAWNALSTGVYMSLGPLTLFAVFGPSLFGKKYYAERLVLSHVIAVAIAFPIAVLFPAIGPWVPTHAFTPTAEQLTAQNGILALRSGSWTPTTIALIGFPSFHAILAVLAAFALWGFKFIRWPAAILAALIVISTLTTGWHYACDVIAGLAIVFAATGIASFQLKRT